MIARVPWTVARRCSWRANRRYQDLTGQHLTGPVDPASVLAVRQAIADLPPRQRAAVVLRHFAGYSLADVW